jgi:ABC-type Fe3+-citrate transport system substrate-binding protein
MMTDSDPLYDVRERTGNPEHPSVNDVVDLVLKRAENPRADHQDAHLDESMATVVDIYGSETVRTVTHRILVEEYPFRTATADLNVDNIDGVRIGTMAVQVLEELNVRQDDS